MTKAKQRKKTIEHEDLNKLFEYVEKPSKLRTFTGSRNAAILRILEQTGARAGEVLSVHSTGLRYSDTGFIFLTIPCEEGCKTGSREIPLMATYPDGKETPAGLALRRWQRKRETWLQSKWHGADLSRYLFPTSRGGKIASTNFFTWLSNAAKSSGIDYPVTSHMFRHTRATELVKQGMPLPVLQNLLGHKSINTTMIYTHVDAQDVASYLMESR